MYVCTCETLFYFMHNKNVIEFAKAVSKGTRIKIQFIPIHESYTHALLRNTNYLAIYGQVCFHRWLTFNTGEP